MGTFTVEARSDRRATPAGYSHYQSNHEDNKENKEENLRDAGSCCCHAAKSEEGGNDRDDEEYQGPVEHVVLH